MGEAFITRRGGGGRPFAIIGVTYPAGSICTCSNGSKTLTAKDTTGQAIFIIPSAGTWTVTATDGDETKSVTVEITTEGQVETVSLAYFSGYFYNEGVFDANFEHSELTMNSTITYEDAAIKVVSTSGSIAYGFVVFKNVRLDDFSTIATHYNCSTTYKGGTTIAVVDDADNWGPTSAASGAVAYAFDRDDDTTSSARDLSLDISALSGTYDVAIGFSTQGTSWSNYRLTNYATMTMT